MSWAGHFPVRDRRAAGVVRRSEPGSSSRHGGLRRASAGWPWRGGELIKMHIDLLIACRNRLTAVLVWFVASRSAARALRASTRVSRAPARLPGSWHRGRPRAAADGPPRAEETARRGAGGPAPRVLVAVEEPGDTPRTKKGCSGRRRTGSRMRGAVATGQPGRCPQWACRPIAGHCALTHARSDRAHLPSAPAKDRASDWSRRCPTTSSPLTATSRALPAPLRGSRETTRSSGTRWG